MHSSTVKIFSIEHSRKFHQEENCWFGTMINTQSFMEFHWQCMITNSSGNLVRRSALTSKILCGLNTLKKSQEHFENITFVNSVENG